MRSSILSTELSVPKYLALVFAGCILVLDALFAFYREKPPFLGQRELIQAAFATLAVFETLVAGAILLVITRIRRPLQVVSICLVLYSGFRICVNTFWFIMVVTCLPCG